MAEGGLSKNDDYECYLKDCPLYTSKKSDKTTSISIKSNSSKRYEYSKFREIIVKHYGEENFKHKGKNGKNGYQCKSAKEKVTLTLYDGTQKLLVQGTGHEQWFKEKFGRLAKQLHDIEMEQPKCQGIQLQQQLATQQPIHKKISGQRSPQPNSRQQQSPVTGSEPLVKIEEFKSIFAIPYKYGEITKPTKWPRSTILLYKYSSNATTKYTAIPENTWSKIYNQAKDEDQPEKHAEEIMIDQLIEIQKHLKEKNVSNTGIQAIEVILSYSPCSSQDHNCSTELRTFKASLEKDIRADEAATLWTSKDDVSTVAEGLSKLNIGKDEEVAKINIKITFANFYKHYYKENMEGLKELLKNQIELDILTGDKWLYFFDVVGLDKTTELPEGRKDREEVDIKMFAELMRGKNEH